MSSNDTGNGPVPLETFDWLPTEIYTAIGMVIQKYSLLDATLQYTIYSLVGVDEVVGRLAVQEPRASDKMSVIEDLARLKGVTLDADLVKKLKSDLPKAKSLRDGIAHGLFFKHPEKDGQVLIGATAGTWQPPGMVKGKVKRKIRPEAPHIYVDDMANLIATIQAMYESAKELRRSVAEQMLAQQQ